MDMEKVEEHLHYLEILVGRMRTNQGNRLGWAEAVSGRVKLIRQELSAKPVGLSGPPKA